MVYKIVSEREIHGLTAALRSVDLCNFVFLFFRAACRLSYLHSFFRAPLDASGRSIDKLGRRQSSFCFCPAAGACAARAPLLLPGALSPGSFLPFWSTGRRLVPESTGGRRIYVACHLDNVFWPTGQWLAPSGTGGRSTRLDCHGCAAAAVYSRRLVLAHCIWINCKQWRIRRRKEFWRDSRTRHLSSTGLAETWGCLSTPHIGSHKGLTTSSMSTV